MTMRAVLLAAACSTWAWSCAAAPCRVQATAAELAQVQTHWLDALLRGDRASFDRLTADGFTLVERGRELDRDQMFDTVKGLLGQGMVLRWNVTRPQAEVDCSLAVLTYVNDGSVAARGGVPEPVRWLETAVLRRSRAGWLVQFASSQRMPGKGAAGAEDSTGVAGSEAAARGADAGAQPR